MDQEVNVLELNMGDIIYKYGLKYKKRNDSNKLRPLCIIDDCLKNAQFKYTFYCIKHYNKLAETDEERHKIIDQVKIEVQQNIEKQEKKDRDLLEDNSKTIDGIKIYIIDDKKFRKRESDNRLWPVCMFEGCNKYSKGGINCSKWCGNHVNGTDPLSFERKEKRKKVLEMRKINGVNSNIVGEATEDWVYNIMVDFNTINSVNKIGYNGHKLDIIYKTNNEEEYRGVQIKTLQVNNKSKDSFNLEFKKEKYSEDTLIVGTNVKRDRFVLFYTKEMSINEYK